MSLFRKPKNRKFKQRSKADSDDEGGDQTINLDSYEEDIATPINSTDQSLSEERKEPIKNVKLSFAHDDDGEEEFKVKRSNSSIRALKQLERKRKEMKKLNKQTELLNQTKSVRKLMETNKESLEEANSKTAMPSQQIGVINLDEMDSEDDKDDNNDYFKFKKPSSKADAIPDSKTIEMLKRKRFLAKESAGDEDYISLSKDKNYSKRDEYMSAENSSSRLVREDPNDKEAICIDDDENGDLDDDRVNFYMDKSNLQKERIKEAFFNAQHEELDERADRRFIENKDSDDELELWEQSRVKSGLQQQKDFKTNDLNNYFFANQRNQQIDPYEPPPYIKLLKPHLSKDKLLAKYKEELFMVDKELDSLHNQFHNIELTIANLREALQEEDNQ